jgi:hypothetical protein
MICRGPMAHGHCSYLGESELELPLAERERLLRAKPGMMGTAAAGGGGGGVCCGCSRCVAERS